MLTSALTLVENRKTEDHRSEIWYGAKYGRALPRHRRHPGQFNTGYQKSVHCMWEVGNNKICFIFKQKRNWKKECPNRESSMTDVIKDRVREAGGTIKRLKKFSSVFLQEGNYQ